MALSCCSLVVSRQNRRGLRAQPTIPIRKIKKSLTRLILLPGPIIDVHGDGDHHHSCRNAIDLADVVSSFTIPLVSVTAKRGARVLLLSHVLWTIFRRGIGADITSQRHLGISFFDLHCLGKVWLYIANRGVGWKRIYACSSSIGLNSFRSRQDVSEQRIGRNFGWG